MSSGDNGDWTTYSLLGYETIFTKDFAHSGSWLSWLGGADNEVGYIEQTLLVPVDKPILTYWGWIDLEETDCGVDFVSYVINNVTYFGYNLCDQMNTNGWGLASINLSDYAGEPTTFQIRVTTNSTDISDLYLDDFAFSSVPTTQNIPSKSGIDDSNQQRIPATKEILKSDKLAPAHKSEIKTAVP